MPDPKVWCLVDGGKIPFSVDISLSLTIHELKAKIMKMNQNQPLFQTVDAFELMLWKVRYF